MKQTSTTKTKRYHSLDEKKHTHCSMRCAMIWHTILKHCIGCMFVFLFDLWQKVFAPLKFFVDQLTFMLNYENNFNSTSNQDPTGDHLLCLARKLPTNIIQLIYSGHYKHNCGNFFCGLIFSLVDTHRAN